MLVQRALSPRTCPLRHTRTASSTSHLQLCRHDPWHRSSGTAAWKGSCHGLVGRFTYGRLMSVLTSASLGELQAFLFLKLCPYCSARCTTTIQNRQPRAQCIDRQKSLDGSSVRVSE